MRVGAPDDASQSAPRSGLLAGARDSSERIVRMIGLILVTHGNLAAEFVHAMEHVVGRQEAIATVCIGPNDDVERRRKDIADAIRAVDSGGGAIILTDLFGGTPSNLAISLMEAGRVEVIADELIDIDKVEGRVKASSIRKIGEIVEKHPEEALSILRTWMYQES